MLAVKIFHSEFGPLWILTTLMGEDHIFVEQTAEACELLTFIATELRPPSRARPRRAAPRLAGARREPWLVELEQATNLSPATRAWLADICGPGPEVPDPLVPRPTIGARVCAWLHRCGASGADGNDGSGDALQPPIVIEGAPRPPAAPVHLHDEAQEPAIPVIICAGLNSVPISTPARLLQFQGLHDVVATHGVGWSGTGTVDVVTRILSRILPSCCALPLHPLRLDYIWLDVPPARASRSCCGCGCNVTDWGGVEVAPQPFGRLAVAEVATLSSLGGARRPVLLELVRES